MFHIVWVAVLTMSTPIMNHFITILFLLLAYVAASAMDSDDDEPEDAIESNSSEC